MKKYKKYLENKTYAPKTIREIINQTKRYHRWLENKNLESQDLSYVELQNYIGYLQTKPLNVHSINQHIRSVGHYQRYKKHPDPTIEVRLLGRQEKYNILLTNEEIEKILKTYKETEPYEETEWIILNLIIYQALERHELGNLKKSEIDLEEGIININQSQKRNNRKLKLESHQILSLQKYIQTIPETRKKFIIYGNLRQKLENLLKTLQKHKIYHKVPIENYNQLRQTRYKEWIKQYGLRKAQYLGGFKSIKGIQKYKDQDLEDLKENIRKYHPLQ
jgi:integrase/recombinase XerD